MISTSATELPVEADPFVAQLAAAATARWEAELAESPPLMCLRPSPEAVRERRKLWAVFGALIAACVAAALWGR